jgi:HPt (histidine-containing phosphotransfer) domain-containing protein
MVDRVRLMLQVLEKREQDSRRELARQAREVAAKQAKVTSVDQWIDTVNKTLQEAIDARNAGGPRTVASMIESDTHAKALSAGSQQLRQLRVTAQQAVDAAIPKQKLAAREWQRSDARLDRMELLARKARIKRALKVSDAEDEAHADRRPSHSMTGGKSP